MYKINILILLALSLVACSEIKENSTLGHRFIIEGDFDGDGKQEKITEAYDSKLTQQPLHKHYPHILEYDSLVEYIAQQVPFLYLTCDNPQIKNFFLSDDMQNHGLLYLKNEGDLNGDGNDEISYIIDWLDHSAVNTCHIATYRNNKWEEIYVFDIWDWLVPPYAKLLPSDTAVLKELNVEYKAFNGLIKKIDAKHFEIIHMNAEAMTDTSIVTIQ